MKPWTQFSMTFPQPETEAGYVRSCSKALLTRSRQLGTLFMVAMIFLLLFRLHLYKPWRDADADLRTLLLSYTCVLSVGLCGAILYVFLSNPCEAPALFHRGVHCHDCHLLGAFFLVLPLSTTWPLPTASTCRRTPVSLKETALLPLPLAVTLGSTHMLLSVRWIVMLPSQFLCLSLYMGVSLTLGLHTRVAIFNSILLFVFILCISLSKTTVGAHGSKVLPDTLEREDASLQTLSSSSPSLRGKHSLEQHRPSTPRLGSEAPMRMRMPSWRRCSRSVVENSGSSKRKRWRWRQN